MVLMIVLTILGIILSLIFLYKNVATTTSKISNSNNVQRLPPSPTKLPIIGNLHQLSSLPHRSLRSLSDRYGPLMFLHIGRLPILVISSPSIVREVTQLHDRLFCSRPSLKAPYELLYNGRDIAFAPYGEYWRVTKKVSILHLLSNKKVASYKQMREEEVVFMMKEMERTILVDMTERLNAISRDVISRAVIGEAARNMQWEDEVKSLIKESSKLIGEFYVGDFIPWMGKIDWVMNGFERRVRKTFQRLDKLLEGIVKEHRRRVEKRKEEGEDINVANECFLDVLLTLEEELKLEGIVFDSKSIKAIIMDMFGAGADATSISMEWTMAELLKNPTTMKKLKEEITRVVGPNKPIIKEEQLIHMSYLKAVVKESLRLHPVGTLMTRQQVTEETNIRGYMIPKGTMLIINAWAIGRDPKLWDSPEEFHPERFINGEARDINFNSHEFQFLAFGAGRRSCPGNQFSVTLIELVIANMVYIFDLKPMKSEPKDIDMGEDYGLTTRKREALLVIARKTNK